MALVTKDLSSTWGLDCSAKTTPAMLTRFASTALPNGQRCAFVIRYVFFRNALANDIDSDELQFIISRGLGVALVQHPRAPTWNHLNASTGDADADWAIRNAIAAGYDPAKIGGQPVLFLDMEGVQPGSDGTGHAVHWVTKVRNAGFRPGVYFGFDSGCNPSALGDFVAWCDFAPYVTRPKLPYALKQSPQVNFCGTAVDPDQALPGGGFVAVVDDGTLTRIEGQVAPVIDVTD